MAVLLNEMVEQGIIADYAVFGAVAQMRYTEAVVTLYTDILVAVAEPDKLHVLSPIYAFCRERGYLPEGEAICVGDWPVQFIPAFSKLTRESIRDAETGDLDGIPLRVIRVDYLSVIALSVGRAKDFACVLALCEAGAVIDKEISDLAMRHNLTSECNLFTQFLIFTQYPTTCILGIS